MERRQVLHGAAALLLGTIPAMAWAGGDSRYDAYTAAPRVPLRPEGGLSELVRFATLAPNSHNTQAWRFHATDREIVIRSDASRRTPVVDPDDHHLFVSLGAAAENLAIAGRAAGFPGDLAVDGDGQVRYRWTRAAPTDDPLAAAIPRRQSVRSVYDGQPIEPALLRALSVAGQAPGVRLVLLTDRLRLDRLRDLVVAGNDRQMRDRAFLRELKLWIRFNADEAMTTGDGLYTATTGNPEMPRLLGSLLFDLFLSRESENDKAARQIASSSGVAVFLADTADPRHWVEVGRAAERFLLEATRRGLAAAFANQPVEVPALRPALAALVGENALRPDLVIRFGRAAALPWSPRRSVADIVVQA